MSLRPRSGPVPNARASRPGKSSLGSGPWIRGCPLPCPRCPAPRCRSRSTTRPARACTHRRRRRPRGCTCAASRPTTRRISGTRQPILTFDLVNRVWRDNGLDVNYVQNVTDIDDPLLERAARDGEDWDGRSPMREIALFREDMEALRIIPPAHYVGAVESIPAIADQVTALLDDGVAYRLDDGTGDVYFDVAADAALRLRVQPDPAGDARVLRRAWRRPGARRQARRARPAAVARRSRGRAGVARRRPRPRPSRLAHRVRRDRAGPARRHDRGAGRRQRPAVPAPRDVRCARRDPHREGAVRRALHARRHDRPARREDEQEQGQPGLRLAAARRPRRFDGGATRPARRPLPQRPAVDRRGAQDGRAPAGPLA